MPQFVSAALFIVGAVFALKESAGSNLTNRTNEVWEGLSFKDRAFFNDNISELRNDLRNDAITIGVLAIVGASLTVIAGCGGLVMLRRQWSLAFPCLN